MKLRQGQILGAVSLRARHRALPFAALLLLAALHPAAQAKAAGAASFLPGTAEAPPWRRALAAADGASAAADAGAAAWTPPTGQPYNMGAYTVTDIWVDVRRGSNSNDGTSRTRALRTLGEAWGRVANRPTRGQPGRRIMIVTGTLTEADSECGPLAAPELLCCRYVRRACSHGAHAPALLASAPTPCQRSAAKQLVGGQVGQQGQPHHRAGRGRPRHRGPPGGQHL